MREPMTNGEAVHKGGLLQKPGSGNDYTISAAAITFLSAPANGANIEVVYFK